MAWCLDTERAPLPASPETLASYLRWMIDRPERIVVDRYRVNGKDIERKRKQGPAKTSTVRRHQTAIGIAHRAAGVEDPTKALYVTTIAKGIRNERGTVPKQKKAFERDALLTALARADGDRLIDVRNRAIMLLAWTGAFRRSEIVWIDATISIVDAEHGLEVILRRSKTNQDGQHESVLIPFARHEPHCAVRAVDAWRARAGIESGPLFRFVDRHGHVHPGRLKPGVLRTSPNASRALRGSIPTTSAPIVFAQAG